VIATFKETLTSWKNVAYGRDIITKPVKSVLWYWTKYLILISLIPFILIIFLLTRLVPQSPRLIRDYLPEGTLTMTDHTLSSTITQPSVFRDGDFEIIFDLNATPSAFSSTASGILIGSDRLTIRSADGQLQNLDYSAIPDFSTDKFQLADWIQSRLREVWFGGFLIITVLGLILFALSWFWRVVGMLIGALLFWAVLRYFMHRDLRYLQVLNLVVYASVLPLLLSVLLFFVSGDVTSLINIAILIYFVYNWVKNIDTPQVSSVTASPKAGSGRSSGVKKRKRT